MAPTKEFMDLYQSAISLVGAAGLSSMPNSSWMIIYGNIFDYTCRKDMKTLHEDRIWFDEQVKVAHHPANERIQKLFRYFTRYT